MFCCSCPNSKGKSPESSFSKPKEVKAAAFCPEKKSSLATRKGAEGVSSLRGNKENLRQVFKFSFSNDELDSFLEGLDEPSMTLLYTIRRLCLIKIEGKECEKWSNKNKENDFSSFLNEVDKLIRGYVLPLELEGRDSVASAFGYGALFHQNLGLAWKSLKFKNIKPGFDLLRGKVGGKPCSNMFTLISLTQSLAKTHPFEALWLFRCIDFIKTKITSNGKLKKGVDFSFNVDAREAFVLGSVLRFLFSRIKTDVHEVKEGKLMKDVFEEFATAVGDLPAFKKSGKGKRPYLMVEYIMKLILYEQDITYKKFAENVFIENEDHVISISVLNLLNHSLNLKSLDQESLNKSIQNFMNKENSHKQNSAKEVLSTQANKENPDALRGAYFLDCFQPLLWLLCLGLSTCFMFYQLKHGAYVFPLIDRGEV